MNIVKMITRSQAKFKEDTTGLDMLVKAIELVEFDKPTEHMYDMVMPYESGVKDKIIEYIEKLENIVNI